MTNEQIIFNASSELMKQGIIKGTGKFLPAVDHEGNETTIEIPEEIHTFAHWKELGYSVRRGEKAIAKLNIWKCVTKKRMVTEEESNTIEVDESSMFMKSSAFFAAHQVEPLKARA